jgi:hypothetical protein
VLVVGAVLTAGVLSLGAGDDRATDAGAAPTTTAAPGSVPTTGPSTTSSISSTTTTLDSGAVVPTDRFAVAPGTGTTVGTGPLRTYSVEVEEGIPIDPAAFAAAVEAVLGDARGWTAPGDVALQRVDGTSAPDFRVRLATPATTDVHCAPLATNGRYSCRNGEDVMINLTRWIEGAAPSGLALEEYRQYLISHEVGHALGHEHEGCPGPGQRAPVMLQQTKGLEGCAPNPWPHP